MLFYERKECFIGIVKPYAKGQLNSQKRSHNMTVLYVADYRVSPQKQGGEAGLGLKAKKQAVKDFLSQFGGKVTAKYMK